MEICRVEIKVIEGLFSSVTLQLLVGVVTRKILEKTTSRFPAFASAAKVGSTLSLFRVESLFVNFFSIEFTLHNVRNVYEVFYV